MLKKTTFALFFGNRGFFPPQLIAEAREEIPRVLKDLGHDYLMLDEKMTKFGAVETPQEGEIYAKFLEKNKSKFGGVILSLPNFGDETGAITALVKAGVPILIQAYPDKLDMMSPVERRDSFCGKLSIEDVFVQYGIPFTNLSPHTVSPSSDIFKKNINYFDRVCRVVKGLDGLTVGAIGARTTAFKTVRIDELALQKNGITMETFDLSDVIKKVREIDEKGDKYRLKKEALTDYTIWDAVPQEAFSRIVKLGVVIDDLIEENRLDAIAIRCWIELQEQLGISPCVLLSFLNNQHKAAACEVDIGNAIAMYVLKQASGEVAACLDWNNNYGDDDNKCILFHCGPVPQTMMKEKGRVTDHIILTNALGKGKGFGCNVGRIKPGSFTFSSMLTVDGRIKFYAGEGEFTNDPIPENFFGCAGTAEILSLQNVLLYIGSNGYRHHTSVTPLHVVRPVVEALTKYKSFEVVEPQKNKTS